MCRCSVSILRTSVAASGCWRRRRRSATSPTRPLPPAAESRVMKMVYRSLSLQIARLRRDQAGVSAVEFAMLLPLMLTLYLGAVEISQGVAIDRKVTLTAHTVADLASQVA